MFFVFFLQWEHERLFKKNQEVFEIFAGVRGGGGGAVNHLPKNFLQVAQFFTKQSKGNEGHTMH